MPLPVQTGTGTSASGSTVTGTWTTATTAGNLLVAFVSCANFASSLSTPSGWSKAVEKVNGSTDICTIFYSFNAASQTSQAFSVPSGRANVEMAEYSGMLTTSSVLDQTKSGTSFGTTASGSTATTTSANEVWFCGVHVRTTGLTFSFNNSLVNEAGDSNTNIQSAIADKAVTATGVFSETVSWGGSSQTWTLLQATFVQSSGGGAVAPSSTLALMGVG